MELARLSLTMLGVPKVLVPFLLEQLKTALKLSGCPVFTAQLKSREDSGTLEILIQENRMQQASSPPTKGLHTCCRHKIPAPEPEGTPEAS